MTAYWFVTLYNARIEPREGKLEIVVYAYIF
jgi:hypothetical protein